jgi:hypothetical protein
MKNYIIIFLALFIISCDDYLDINQDPNRATTADPGPIFTGVITQYSTNRVIDLGPALSTATQAWSGGGSLGAGVFTDPENYDFSIFTTGNTWRAYYREMQKNISLAIQGAIDLNDNNAQAQARIMRALTYYSTTVLWGDVPFSEAVNVDFSVPEITNLNPRFDPQQEVLAGIVAELDEALALIDGPTSNSIAASDLIFGGNMDLWAKFARSLKFRTLMTMVDADPSVAEEINRMVAAGGMISSSSENAAFPFFDQAGNRNPFWGTLNTFAGGANFFYFAGERMVEVMKSKDDPRIPAYFTPFPGGGSPEEVVGSPPGVTNIGFRPWVLSTASPGTTELVRPSSPDVLFSYSEQMFLEAEAIARGLASGGMSEADSRLRAGIRAAMEQFSIPTEDIDAYLENSIPSLDGISQDEALTLIAEEIFVDCVVRPLEHFVHWRRTERLNLEVPAQAVTTNLVRRLPYPPDELSANSNAPMNLPVLDEKMWFDQ